MVNLVDSSLEFWLTSGRYTDEFEKKLAEYLHVRYCALVNSGSSANLVAFMTLTSPLLGDRRVKRGDEIITVAAGFPTTVTPAIQYGAVPVFVDVTIPQYNIDVTKLEEALSEKTKASRRLPIHSEIRLTLRQSKRSARSTTYGSSRTTVMHWDPDMRSTARRNSPERSAISELPASTRRTT